MTYTVDKVIEIINNYSINMDNIRNYQKEYASRGVAVISSLPSANTISDVTASEALKHADDTKFINTIKSDMKFLEDRLHKIRSDRYAEVVAMKMAGYESIHICNTFSISLRTVRHIVRESAIDIATI